MTERPAPPALRPIGRVEAGALRLRARLAPALAGIEGFSHLIVLTWLGEARRPALIVRPSGLCAFPRVGYLATRTPHRHNPIGVTVVRLLGRQGTLLRVRGLDAWPGTPVLDVKPYTLKDAVPRPRLPSWVRRLDRREADPLRRYAERGRLVNAWSRPRRSGSRPGPGNTRRGRPRASARTR